MSRIIDGCFLECDTFDERLKVAKQIWHEHELSTDPVISAAGSLMGKFVQDIDDWYHECRKRDLGPFPMADAGVLAIVYAANAICDYLPCKEGRDAEFRTEFFEHIANEAEKAVEATRTSGTVKDADEAVNFVRNARLQREHGVKGEC